MTASPSPIRFFATFPTAFPAPARPSPNRRTNVCERKNAADPPRRPHLHTFSQPDRRAASLPNARDPVRPCEPVVEDAAGHRARIVPAIPSARTDPAAAPKTARKKIPTPPPRPAGRARERIGRFPPQTPQEEGYTREKTGSGTRIPRKKRFFSSARRNESHTAGTQNRKIRTAKPLFASELKVSGENQRTTPLPKRNPKRAS